MRRALVGAMAVTAVAALSPPAAAAPEGRVRPLVAEALGELSPELAGVEVDDEGYRQAYDAWREATAGLEEAVAAGRGAEGRLGGLRSRRDQLAERLAQDRGARERAAWRAERAQRSLVDLAVASFVGDDPTGALDEVLEDMGDDVGRRAVLGEVATDDRVDRLRRAADALDAARAAEAATTAAFVDAEASYEEVRRARAEADRHAAAERRRLDTGVADMVALAPLAPVAGTDLRVVVLDAYWRGQRDGPCPLPWAALAAIGRVESGHGTSGDAEPDEAGNVSPTITGIPLDGDLGTATIADSDGGQLDGDDRLDRAVGPMQFIPSTWRRWGTDATGDGAPDPDNFYDAAGSAARYLCRAAQGRPDLAGLERAVFSYNHSRSYVRAVLGHAERYASEGLVLPPPSAAP